MLFTDGKLWGGKAGARAPGWPSSQRTVKGVLEHTQVTPQLIHLFVWWRMERRMLIWRIIFC